MDITEQKIFFIITGCICMVIILLEVFNFTKNKELLKYEYKNDNKLHLRKFNTPFSFIRDD
jgi:hypothetical protein